MLKKIIAIWNGEQFMKGIVEKFGEMISDGDYIAIGGFGANRIPTAICHEIVRQGKKGLGFAGHTSTHDFQIFLHHNR